MLHLDQGGSWVDIYRMKDEISLTVPTDRDYISELKESPDDLLPEAEIPLQQGRGVKAELSNQPLDSSILGKSVELFMGGGFRGGKNRPRGEWWGGSNILHRSNDGIWLNADILVLQVIDKDGRAAIGLYLLQDRVVPQEGTSRGLQQHQGPGREGQFWLHRQNAARPSRDLPGLLVRTNLGRRPMRVVLLSPGRRSCHMKGANLRGGLERRWSPGVAGERIGTSFPCICNTPRE